MHGFKQLDLVLCSDDLPFWIAKFVCWLLIQCMASNNWILVLCSHGLPLQIAKFICCELVMTCWLRKVYSLALTMCLWSNYMRFRYLWYESLWIGKYIYTAAQYIVLTSYLTYMLEGHTTVTIELKRWESLFLDCRPITTVTEIFWLRNSTEKCS